MSAELKGQLPLFGNEPVAGEALTIPGVRWRSYHPKRLFCDECLADRANGYDGRIFKARWVRTTEAEGQTLLCSVHAEERRLVDRERARRQRQ